MVICDRCQAKATEQITFASTDERIDLCDSCSYEVKEFANTEKQGIVDGIKKIAEKLTKSVENSTNKE
jgi:protein-arginine kinase activator protein McsA